MAHSTKATGTGKTPSKPWRKQGFVQTGSLLSAELRGVSEKRGFAETQLLTRWAEIAGPEIASHARPVKVTYASDGFGATLVLLCDGAHGPELEMQAPAIRDRVNACYGYNAISRVRITQTSAAGFAEPPRAFTPKPAEPDPKVRADAARTVENVTDDGLRAALCKLGENILSAKNPPRG